MNLLKPFFFSVVLFLICNNQILNAQLGKYQMLRTWTDSSGNYKLKARLVSTSKNLVQLKTEVGEPKELPLEKLSKKDREFLIGYTSAVFSDLRDQVRQTVFAKDALDLYQDYDSKGLIGSNNRVYVDSQIVLLKEETLNNAILINNAYIPLERLKKIKPQSLKDVNAWIDTIASAGSAKKDQKLIKKGIANDPTSLEGSIILAIWLEVALADHEGAQRHLERVIDKAEKYSVIATETDKYNYRAALNNLAVSYAKKNKISKAIKLWSKIHTTASADLPDEVPLNVARLAKMISNNNSGLTADIDDKKALEELSALVGKMGDASSWNIMVPTEISSVVFAVDPAFASISGNRILDSRCINCDGSRRDFCPIKVCKKGGIKVPVIGPKYFQGKYIGDGIVDWKFEKCTHCDGSGLVNCRCCYPSTRYLPRGIVTSTGVQK
jgi:hypothetical protein